MSATESGVQFADDASDFGGECHDFFFGFRVVEFVYTETFDDGAAIWATGFECGFEQADSFEVNECLAGFAVEAEAVVVLTCGAAIPPNARERGSTWMR